MASNNSFCMQQKPPKFTNRQKLHLFLFSLSNEKPKKEKNVRDHNVK